MTISDDELTAISGWTDDDIQDNVRAAGVLYAAAALEELSLIALVERLNELNQQKMLSIGAGQASNLLHEFWDQGYKRMTPKRRAALYARVFGTSAGEAADPAASNDAFAGLWLALVEAISEGSSDDVAPAATALRDNLAEHTDEASSAAAAELRKALGEIAEVLSDRELRAAYRADDMWQVIEAVHAEIGGGSDVPRARTLARSGAVILRRLPELCDGAPADGELADAASEWLAANARAAD